MTTSRFSTSTNRSLSLVALGLSAALVLSAGCSSTSAAPRVTTGDRTEREIPAAPSPTGPSTTSTSSTSTTSTSTTSTTLLPVIRVPAPDELLLRANGLGPKDFGSSPTDVISQVTTVLGAPASDSYRRYPHYSGSYRLYIDRDHHGFGLPYTLGRSVCWTGPFCIEFGGKLESDLLFIGWSYGGHADMLRSSSGLTIGSRWSDFPSMYDVYATCYHRGAASDAGMSLALAAGVFEWFTVDASGGFVEHLPDPAIATVVWMQAGTNPFDIEYAC